MYVSSIEDKCVVNASEATPRRCYILGMFWGICSESTGGGSTHAVVSFQQRCIAAALLESCLCVRCSPVDLLHVFGAPYYGMASEGLLSLHHRLQTHCIVYVNTCRKGLDDKTIVFCRSLQILTSLG